MNAPPASSDIKNELTEYFASTLRLPVHQIESDVHILELGVDSITLIEAQRWLKARFDVFIEVAQFFDDLNTIDRLAAFLSVTRFHSDSATNSETSVQPSPPKANGAPEQALVSARKTLASGNEYGLMRSQLALLGDVIEAQNRLLMTFHRARVHSDDA